MEAPRSPDSSPSRAPRGAVDAEPNAVVEVEIGALFRKQGLADLLGEQTAQASGAGGRPWVRSDLLIRPPQPRTMIPRSAPGPTAETTWPLHGLRGLEKQRNR